MLSIGFGAAIRSFLNSTRPLIVDVALLKGIYIGTNLLADGMDGNNQIIPIATGVCEGKSKESWSWFLNNLKESVDEVLKQEVSKKLVDAGFEKWYRTHCLHDFKKLVDDVVLGNMGTGHIALFGKNGSVLSYICPKTLQDVLPPVMEKHQSGLPKNKDRIQSQGERKNNICHVLVLGQPNANGREGASQLNQAVSPLACFDIRGVDCVGIEMLVLLHLLELACLRPILGMRYDHPEQLKPALANYRVAGRVDHVIATKRWVEAKQYRIIPSMVSSCGKDTNQYHYSPPLLNRMPGRTKNKSVKVEGGGRGYRVAEVMKVVWQRVVEVVGLEGEVGRGQGRGGRGRGRGGTKMLVDEQEMSEDEIRKNMKHEYIEHVLIEEEEKRIAVEKANQEEFDKEVVRLTIEEEARYEKLDQDISIEEEEFEYISAWCTTIS
ncbi:hypothetical protein Tco_1276312 [Tanacetum coccineum]